LRRRIEETTMIRINWKIAAACAAMALTSGVAAQQREPSPASQAKNVKRIPLQRFRVVHDAGTGASGARVIAAYVVEKP
jgi:hypothetical protein